MADLLDEDLIPFAPAIRSLPGRPHVSTGYRFISRGSHGVILETVVVGGRRFTSRQALRRFVAAVTAAASYRPVTTSSRPSPEPIIDDRIERDLNKFGL